jgi:DNA primase
MSAVVVSKNLVISWPASSGNYVLQVTSSLTPPVSWTTAPVNTVNINGQITAVIPASATRSFYRLIQ